MAPLDSLHYVRLLRRVSLKERKLLQQFQKIRQYSSYDTRENTQSEPDGEVLDLDTEESSTRLISSTINPPVRRVISRSDSRFDSSNSYTEVHYAELPRSSNDNVIDQLKNQQIRQSLVRRTTIARNIETPQCGAWNFNPFLRSFESQSPTYGSWDENSYQSSVSDHDLNDYEKAREATDDHLRTGEEILHPDYSENSLNLDEARYEEVSTITPGEKSAFQKIFREVFESKQWEETVSVFGDPVSENTIAEEKMKQEKKRIANRELIGVLSDSIHQPSRSLEKISENIDFYPPALRPAILEALRLDIDSSNMKELNHRQRGIPFNDPQFVKDMQHKRELENRLETVRDTERDRVEGLMRAAATDFDLWKVLEDEVFSLIHKLGLEDKLKHAGPLSSTRFKQKKVKAQSHSNEKLNLPSPSATESPPLEEPDQSTDALATEHGVSPLRLYGPLYPSYLLLGLRLLDRSFSRPSPLALALLPKIKSMGYISRVLGASTQFYNELLLIYQFRHCDFQGMLRLLEEMELSSLAWNQETLDIIYNLIRLQDRNIKGTQGHGLSVLWSMPNFARERFVPWRDYIRDVLNPMPLPSTVHKIGWVSSQKKHF